MEKTVRDLKHGDLVELASGQVATVNKAYRDTLFEGDVWAIEHSQGEANAMGGDVVAMVRK